MAGDWDRRSVLRAAAVLAAGAPLLGGTALAQAGGDADALFKAGKFEQAGRAYEEILKRDPQNVHAASQRGYVALLSNRFSEAEEYLGAAVALAPADKAINRVLADCFTRQDKLGQAAPHLRAAGAEAEAEWCEAFRGQPYEIRGDTARLPWLQMDPIPQVEGSLNGGPPKRLSFYTRVGPLNVSARVAEEAGIQVVAKEKVEYLDKWFYYGILDSFRLGEIELRNIPVHWSDGEPSADSDGIFGTSIFYHLLTTVDYAGRQLILRRRTPENSRQARIAAERAGAEPLPLWLVRDHLILSRGSFADSGPRVAGLHIGGTGSNVAGVFRGTAEELGIRIDHERPEESAAGGLPITVYPCYPKEVRLGNAFAKGAYSVTSERNLHDGHGFDVLGDFAHSFYKPYNVTLDFTAMKVYLARGPA
ncbi:tetratricopeptide repeat protein [Lentzea sp. NPDC006480]|uniref:tetratricopeptide repeat protein n=1 Tax=Lentzea sp. NPDC006480 TaxID=3157176 RepID=UPI0033B832E8